MDPGLARDLAGNRVPRGRRLRRCASTPMVRRWTDLVLQPASPIRNSATNPVLSSPTSPSCWMTTSLVAPCRPSLDVEPAPGRSGSVSNFVLTGPRIWTGQLQLPAAAGQAPEQLAFTYSAADDIGNVGRTIRGAYLAEIYQGDLPSLDSPFGLTARARPSGAIALEWKAMRGRPTLKCAAARPANPA